MIQLSWWEQFIVTAGVSLLTLLHTKIKNETQIAACEAAIDFLNTLLMGQVGGE